MDTLQIAGKQSVYKYYIIRPPQKMAILRHTQTIRIQLKFSEVVQNIQRDNFDSGIFFQRLKILGTERISTKNVFFQLFSLKKKAIYTKKNISPESKFEIYIRVIKLHTFLFKYFIVLSRRIRVISQKWVFALCGHTTKREIYDSCYDQF